MTTDQIDPAMTAEEWAHEGGARHVIHRGIVAMDDGGATTIDMGDASLSFVGKHRHAVAALCLHGQAFGFTRADVEALRYVRAYVEDPTAPYEGSRTIAVDTAATKQLRALAARLAALLPPNHQS